MSSSLNSLKRSLEIDLVFLYRASLAGELLNFIALKLLQQSLIANKQ